MDGGVIAALKGQYQRRLLFRVFGDMDAEAKTVYDLDVPMSMR